MANEVQSQARVVVIGGGIAGCSTLWHLTQLGWHDVVLIERDELTAGSTWHAAGNCPSFSGSWNIIKLQRYGNELYGRLGELTDSNITYHQTGSVRLAHSRERMEEFHHVCGMARAQGIDFEMLSNADLKNRFPFMETHDLLGGLWDPTDGDIDPSQVTQAFARGARAAGARIYRNNKVEGIRQLPGGEWEVQTADGAIRCEIVVNAGGYRVNEISGLVGVRHPVVSMEHQYLVTEAIPALEDWDGHLPLLRDPDISYYLRQERKGLILGPYERDCKACWVDSLPDEFAMELFEPELDRLEFYIEDAMKRVPILAEGGVQRVINGPIPYTPDGLPLIGPVHGLDNFYLCAAFSFGIAQGGGAGKCLAEMIVHGQAEWDTWVVDPRRYTDYANLEYTRQKAIELYSREYDINFPFEERPAGRPAKTSPLYGTLKAKRAMFCARAGWERAAWFPPEDMAAVEQASFHRTNWFEAVGQECKAVRERVAILDLPGFAKFEVSGTGAAQYLDRLVAGRLPRIGRIGLCYVCTERGGVQSEFTVTRWAENRFYLCCAGGAEWHDEQLLSQHSPADGSVRLDNVTGLYGTLVIAGPESRTLLERVTDADLSNAAFPWLSAQPIEIGFMAVRALRVNYVGELGWELHLPMASMQPVYDRLMLAGADLGIADFGMYALDSLRLEKCYRGWKVDLVDEYSPLESSLDRFVDLDKGPFPGREALRAQQQGGLGQRLVPLLVEAEGTDAPVCATVFQDLDTVGLVTSGGYGYTVGKSIALAYVRIDLTEPGTALEVDIFGQRRAATVVSEPIYDPDNSRLRA